MAVPHKILKCDTGRKIQLGKETFCDWYRIKTYSNWKSDKEQNDERPDAREESEISVLISLSELWKRLTSCDGFQISRPWGHVKRHLVNDGC
ncbi:hypothetical protein KIN20_030559 [Parelaphostrongylus tenuis]|uniref:Uncharacterized protein n=1 Tax=Parelaphostrongylus tenuis TaxID=148309 RepID=A0AAD5WGK0_PARTN|nr:hypothetical protein KIN20_030559 [Parelaphostrongylus tenuis]